MAGGLAIDFPTITLHESFAYPTSMFLRNLMSMDTEEMIKAQPMDGCVMIGGCLSPSFVALFFISLGMLVANGSCVGCDKTVPAQLMGGISANKPVLPLITGPMMPGSHRGERLGACTDCRNNWAAYRAGTIDVEEISAINEELAPTVGSPLPPHPGTLDLNADAMYKVRNMRRNGHSKHNGLPNRRAGHDAPKRRLSTSRLLCSATHRRRNRFQRRGSGTSKSDTTRYSV